MTKLDLHLHTSRHSPDSVMDPFAMLERACEVGLDGVVISEHDYLWPDEELEELRAAAPDLVVLAGVEVSARDGDVLVYGIRDPFALPRGIAWRALCDEVHRQGGVAVAAHPYRWGQDFDALLARQRANLDGIELISNNMDPAIRRRAKEHHAANPRLAGLGNSDAHDVETLGCCYTEFAANVRTVADLVAAIRARLTTPRERPRR